MSTTTQPPSIAESFGGFVPYRMSIEQYEAMVASGVFTSEDRFELIEGLLVAKMTKYPPHSVVTQNCGKIFDRILYGKGWHARTEEPIRIPTRSSEPEPDVALARGDVLDYADKHPDSEDIALVVEVSDTSLQKDRKLAKTYGGAGIPVYWIINIPDRQLELFSSPVNGVYSVHQILLETESVDLVIEGRILGRIGVAELLPRP
jgi:Uma2 family endonuclease